MNDPTLNQDEIDALLADISLDGPSGGGAAPAPQAQAAPAEDPLAGLDMDMGASAPAPAPADDGMDALFSGGSPAPAPEPAPEPVAHHPSTAGTQFHAADVPQGNIEVLLDVPLEVVVELGRTEMQIKDVLNLAQGSVVELDRMAGEPINILVNGKLVARGEVVVIDENFGIRITNIISPMERLSQLN